MSGEAQSPTVSPTVNASLDSSELPVWLFARTSQTLAEVEQMVTRSGGTVRQRSRWLHAVSANLPVQVLRNGARDLTVRHIQRIAVLSRINDRSQPAVQRAGPEFRSNPVDYGPSEMPVRILNAIPLATTHNLTGTGVTIAMLDTGFETELPIFATANVAKQWDFVFGDSIVRNEPIDNLIQSNHGTSTWSLLAANMPGTMVGLAPDATYLLAKTEDVRSETRTEEDNFVAALEWAHQNDADIVSASLGYLSFDDGFSYTPDQLNGDVAVTTVAADSAVANGMIVVTSAGNSGPLAETLASPADADSAISVGATDSLGSLASFSSRGPTADGRIKPDLTAPGVAVFSASTISPTGFARVDGTSLAAPLIAGVAALIKQATPTLTPAEVAEAMMFTGSNAGSPDNNSGWGTPNAHVAAIFPEGIRLLAPLTDTLASITPTIAWDHFSVAEIGRPVTTRFVVTTVPDGEVLADTTVTKGTFNLLTPQPPGTRLTFSIEATSSDSLTLILPPARSFVIPPWVKLTNLNDPSGLSIRDARPTFTWNSPEVASPPGPFTYTVTVSKAEDQAVVLSQGGLTATTFRPAEALERNTPYTWSVEAIAGGRGSTAFSLGSFVVIDNSTPFTTLLFQNFPNPFPNISLGGFRTCIWFDLADSGLVTLDILDIRGHRIKNLVPGNGFPDRLEAGRYGRPASSDPSRCDIRLEWDGTDESGTPMPPGVYLYKLNTVRETLFKRIVFRGN